MFQKKLCFTFLLISQLILIVERRVGYPQNWDGKRFLTICDSTFSVTWFTRKLTFYVKFWPFFKGLYLHYKCMNFYSILHIAKYWFELFSGRILALYVKYFLYLMYFKDSPSISSLKVFSILHVLWKKSAKFCYTLPWI